jgi:phosphatidylglycerophosphatase A
LRRIVASGFGIGFLPRRLWGSDRGAGTFGAALGAILSLALWTVHPWGGVMALVAAFAASIWSAAPFGGDHQDPGWVVIDEVAGTLTAAVALIGWPWLIAVAVARIADIFKVLPGVAAAERLPGAWGITMDDVVAGGYGLLAGVIASLVI